jgi:hypothetical protein
MITDEKLIIPPNHKRKLSITSRYIENNINEIEDLLNGRRNNLTEEIENNIEDAVKLKILGLIKEMREKNEKMFNEMDLTEDRLYLDRMIRSRITYIWTILYDSLSKNLTGYGDLLQNEAELVDGHIKSMLELVFKLQSIIK